MAVVIEKIPGGFSIDGFALKNGKCGCTSVAKCCYSWSKIRKKDAASYEFAAKATASDTSDHFTWSYTVAKEGISVKVFVEDARDKEIFSGYLPPAAKDWEAKGWTVTERSGDRADGVVWRCAVCRWLYKENDQGKPFERLPTDWKCPKCGVGKESFEQIG